jgi:spermidine/putrescine transport system ATP-binding protein
MRSIKLINISKSYDGESILENVNLHITEGTFFALLGPSGSGKSTILRLIAGFEEPDAGQIFLGNTDITHLPINQRRINTVFQNYALFPHMDVFDNVGYSLKVAGVPKRVIEEKVISTLKRVHLEKYIHKSIAQLSGGQKQRVAVARAIINEPDVLLFDEPLAALDRKLREHMLLELIDLQGALKTTFIYVTHDQFEALPVADFMAIMNQNGEIEQVGSPKEVYEFPVSTFVARFVGNTNMFRGFLVISDLGVQVQVPDLGSFYVTTEKKRGMLDIVNQKEVFMSLRPEKIAIKKSKQVGFANELAGIVHSIVYHGHSTQYNVKLQNGSIIQVFEQNEEHFPQEVIDYYDSVYLYWQKESAGLLRI